MKAKLKDENLGSALIIQIGLGLLLMFWLLTMVAHGQTTEPTPTPTTTPTTQITTDAVKPAVLTPVIKDYKSVTIGMSADEVKDKLGKAEISDKDGFYYKFDNDQAAQIVLDSKKKVRVISMMYSGKDSAAPSFEDVFGKDVTATAKPNGSIYKLIRYPEAGYWVAYSRTAGDSPLITVTMQRMRKPTAGK